MSQSIVTAANLLRWFFVQNMFQGTVIANQNTSFIEVLSNETEYNWFEAESFCMTTYGSTLASIHSFTDESQMFDLQGKNTSAWLGLNNIESIWRYTDGTNYDFNNSTYWNITDYTDNIKQCVELSSNGYFINTDCLNTKKQFFCNKGFHVPGIYACNV